jgi:hypothetical protein
LSRKDLRDAGQGGAAQSGAVPDDPPSPALSLLLKLTASLTPDERAVLAELLKSDGDRTKPI